MKQQIMGFVFLVVLIFHLSSVSAKVEDLYLFPNPEKAARFQHLLNELRCLVCQNQSLAESNAPLAQDLKKEIYNQMNSGHSEEEIKHYLVARYGEYILFKPSVTKITFVLWLGPFIFLCGAFIILFVSIKR